VLLDAADCHVYLRGFGLAGSITNWYLAVALNGVEYRNQPFPNWSTRGLTTYNVHPSNCTASDFQFFDTYGTPSDSTRLINYLGALADGMSLFPFLSG